MTYVASLAKNRAKKLHTRIGRICAQQLNAKQVVLGGDVSHTSEALKCCTKDSLPPDPSTLRRTKDDVEGKESEIIQALDRTDGVSVEFPDWRLNLCSSNIESLLWLNVETRCNTQVLSADARKLESLNRVCSMKAALHPNIACFRYNRV